MLGPTGQHIVLITNPIDDTQFEVKTAGPDFGKVIFGRTRAGASSSPDSVEIEFRAVSHGADISTSVAYAWEATQNVSLIDVTYGYFQTLADADESAFRTLETLGIFSDAELKSEIDNLQEVLNVANGATSLSGLLSPTTANYPFFSLNATPTVTAALNVLNTSIGSRNYSNALLTDGYTITQSLNQIANAVTSSTLTRTIERLSGPINANTVHNLPLGVTYTPDGSNNGNTLLIFGRGALRHPGSVSSGNDYAETSSTSVTFYAKYSAGDIIDYIIRS